MFHHPSFCSSLIEIEDITISSRGSRVLTKQIKNNWDFVLAVFEVSKFPDDTIT